MPAIVPSHLYTFIAMIAVSTLLVLSFTAYTSVLRSSSETGRLKDLMDRVAAKSTELVTLVLTTNATIENFVQMPAFIGNRQYWLQLRNDSVTAWLEGGLGSRPVEDTELRVYLPQQILATGNYIGGYGAAHLTCAPSSGFPRIQLSNSSTGA